MLPTEYKEKEEEKQINTILEELGKAHQDNQEKHDLIKGIRKTTKVYEDKPFEAEETFVLQVKEQHKFVDKKNNKTKFARSKQAKRIN
ncbi:hypothetical protein JTB14_004910 [Gonioctena quinquepunctata]|nr:hypothetical protein JTB14_004910 [Gonioctena quinquepunctata]